MLSVRRMLVSAPVHPVWPGSGSLANQCPAHPLPTSARLCASYFSFMLIVSVALFGSALVRCVAMSAGERILRAGQRRIVIADPSVVYASIRGPGGGDGAANRAPSPQRSDICLSSYRIVRRARDEPYVITSHMLFARSNPPSPPPSHPHIAIGDRNVTPTPACSPSLLMLDDRSLTYLSGTAATLQAR